MNARAIFTSVLLGATPIALVIAVWQTLVSFGYAPISLLPPPARVSIIAPTSDDARNFLNWLAAEDPALASRTLRPPDARALQLPKLAHIPSYIAVPPELKPSPPQPAENLQFAAMPPGIVQTEVTPKTPPAIATPSGITFSGTLGDIVVAQPPLNFHASSHETPRSALFRVGVDRDGIVRYALLVQSSGDGEIDGQARAALGLFRFDRARLSILPNEHLIWAAAAIDFGTDVTSPSTAKPAP